MRSLLTPRRLIVAATAAELLVFLSFERETLLVSSAAALGLLLRRRFPVLGLLLTLPSIAIGQVWLAPMLAMFDVAVTASRRPVVTACGAGMFLAAACPWPLDSVTELTWQEHLLTVESSLMLSIGPTALGLLARTRAELKERLSELMRSQALGRRLEAERAVVRERSRLARDMHDTVSHHVGIIAVQAGALSTTTTDEGVREDAEVIRRHSVSALEELRNMVGVLRGSDAAAASAAGRTQLADLAFLSRESRLDVTLDLDPALAAGAGGPWAPEAESTAFRTVQEALSNVRKHAPGAPAAISVHVSDDRRALVVEVRNGSAVEPYEGPELPVGGHGLTGLRERAALIGGTLEARPLEGGGFLVRAVLPAAVE
ncbi:two-component sensor histidine kinase [Streptomyces sp. D2-8]|uniref:sensor histidine kinase n=1 Tax=Streptomyces sp. D2-8 TaxID=2707767 RepID=UPI0020BEB38A|nr:histidine kinase [Streptomyces sp. D2-8]MCK8434231.1 two-component sensor histidine kinase [Streptomyces sp. D2-8]